MRYSIYTGIERLSGYIHVFIDESEKQFLNRYVPDWDIYYNDNSCAIELNFSDLGIIKDDTKVSDCGHKEDFNGLNSFESFSFGPRSLIVRKILYFLFLEKIEEYRKFISDLEIRFSNGYKGDDYSCAEKIFIKQKSA